jgi:hypothetical protein
MTFLAVCPWNTVGTLRGLAPQPNFKGGKIRMARAVGVARTAHYGNHKPILGVLLHDFFFDCSPLKNHSSQLRHLQWFRILHHNPYYIAFATSTTSVQGVEQFLCLFLCRYFSLP